MVWSKQSCFEERKSGGFEETQQVVFRNMLKKLRGEDASIIVHCFFHFLIRAFALPVLLCTVYGLEATPTTLFITTGISSG